MEEEIEEAQEAERLQEEDDEFEAQMATNSKPLKAFSSIDIDSLNVPDGLLLLILVLTVLAIGWLLFGPINF